MSEETVQLVAQCLCKARTYTSSLPSSALPLSASCCHCDSCRHLLGTLYLSDVKWPNKDEDLSALEKYSFSKNLNKFFCKQCGSHMFSRGTKSGSVPWVLTGVLGKTPNLIRYDNHTYVGDTVDGGLSPWFRIPHSDGTYPKFWREDKDGDEVSPESFTQNTPPGPGAVASPEPTRFRCHCRGVDLVLRSAADMAGRPDAELPWFVKPKTYKYASTLDACNSCRVWVGSDLMSWTFANLSHIHFAAGTGGDGSVETQLPSSTALPQTVSDLREAVTVDAKDRDPRLGTLAAYQSSHDVWRYHCSRCGASVFYAVDDRPDLVDIGVGLLEHPGGARAEGLLAWSLTRVGGEDDSKGGWREGLASGVEEEIKKWRIARGY
ncbi:uncharacterized protein DNG_03118 [Cephalotrichum gorgonifer]|uniref:CENP-V/GFA domain-containing protein n=1 Tax=Cephalotrichum gorgonifer TaxID=2041049 RepID=A0AAE8STA0_9PEZI|nr:uncharacterized protein DNG_03118 [Cephalotrichum gorgonifer]